jgi:HPr kinase/phosphorylase
MSGLPHDTSVTVTDLINKLQLQNLIPEINTDEIFITVPDVNRPSLQLTGFFEHFDLERVQIIGRVEEAYIAQMSEETKEEIYDRLISSKMPCMIYARGMQPDDIMIKYCQQYEVPLLQSNKITIDLTAEIMRWLKVRLAPTISMHGVLVDVFGEGVMIMGESGIGKSEAALELIKRGHRLVSDDIVEIRKVSDETLVGTAPDITKHMIELRGIGILDVRALFGFESVRDTHQIDMVIKLADWDSEKEYDRLGMDDNYMEILGNKVICCDLPIRPGRNLAIIVESAAINNRQKKMGYNAAKELYKRVQENLDRHGAGHDHTEK